MNIFLELIHFLICLFEKLRNTLQKTTAKPFSTEISTDLTTLDTLKTVQNKEIVMNEAERNKALKRFLSTKNLEDDYVLDSKVLGTGGFSVVLSGRCKKTGKRVALKMIPKEKAFTGMNLLEEISLADALGQNDNVIATYGLYDYKNTYVMVMEFVKDGELLSILLRHFEEGGVYSEAEIAVVMMQVVSAINHCHSRKVVHRDLKPDNILVNDDSAMGGTDALTKNPVKLCDFGMATTLKDGEQLLASCGTAEYMAPERLRGLPYDDKSDIWSVGVMLYILIAGTFPFWGSSNDILKKAESDEYPIMTGRMQTVSKDCKQLLRQLLATNPADRPTAAELLTNPWICGKTANTFEIEGAVRALKKFNAQRKLRMGIRGVIARNRMNFILKAIQAEHLIVDLTMNESFTLHDLKTLFEFMIQQADDNCCVDKQAFLTAFKEIEVRDGKLPSKLFVSFVNNDNKVNVHDFCLSLSTKLSDNTDQVLEFAFEIYDDDNSGTIDIDEFCHMVTGMLATMDEVPSEQWLHCEFENADTDNSGDLSKEEFIETAKNNAKVDRYFRNVRKLLHSRKELFEQEIDAISKECQGVLFVKRTKMFGLLSSFVERYAVLDPEEKILHIFGSANSKNCGDLPMQSLDLKTSEIKMTTLEPTKKKAINRSNSKSSSSLKPTQSRSDYAPVKYRFEAFAESMSIAWEYRTGQEEQAWLDAFISAKIDLV